MHVVVADLDDGRRQGGGRRVRRVTLRSTCRRSVGRASREVSAAVGPIDVLVNNAGADRLAFFVETDERDWDAVLGVNLRGVIACTHAVLPGMLERRSRRHRQRGQ